MVSPFLRFQHQRFAARQVGLVQGEVSASSTLTVITGRRLPSLSESFSGPMLWFSPL